MLRAGARALSMAVRCTACRFTPMVSMLVRWLVPNEDQWRSRIQILVAASVRMLEKHLETCHFVPLFSTSGAASWRRGSLGKLLRHREIGPEASAAGASQVPMA